MKSKSLILLGLMSLAPSVYSQSYSGTISDLNTIFDPPANIQGTICAHTNNDGNEHSYQACSNGVAAARWMAEKYAQRAGKYLGCLDGFSQGVWDGYVAGKSPTPDMLAEANSYVAGSDMISAIERSSERAYAKGETESADEIISRYRKVVGVKRSNGTQVLPSKSPNMPKINFNGYSDGYSYDISSGRLNGGTFDEVIANGYITESSSFEDKIAARKSYLLQGEYASNLCDNQKTIFGRRNMPQVSVWDFFKARRQYNFQDYGWKNASWAWDIYNKDERNIDHYQNFDGIKNLEKNITETTPILEIRLKRDSLGKVIPKLNTDGTIALDDQGHEIYEKEEIVTGYNTETKRVRLSAQDVKEMKALYRKAFKDAYSRYFAKHYSSLRYHEEGLAKYETAKIIGLALGQDVASHLARKEAYDSRYQSVSKAKYAELAEKIYLDSFYRLIGIFENNPVVEIVDGYIVGSTRDNIYRPGEQLSGDFTIQNLGEVSRPVTLRFRNSLDIIANSKGHVFTPKALDNTSVVTGILGQISNDKGARDNVRVNMVLDNPSNLNEVANALSVSKSEGITLREYAEVDKISTNLDILKGEIEVTTKVINPSSIETPALPVITIKAQNSQQEKNMYKIPAESSSTVMVAFSGLDPLELIRKGGVNGSVSIKLGNRVTYTKSYSSRNHKNSNFLYAQYFNSIVNGTSNNFGGKSKAERLKDLFSIIEDKVQYGISDLRTSWKRQHEVDNTIVGDLQKVYRASKASGLVSREVQKNYDALALMLAKKVNNRGRLRVRGFDKYYLRALKKFSKTLSTKARHHR